MGITHGIGATLSLASAEKWVRLRCVVRINADNDEGGRGITQSESGEAHKEQ